MENRNLFYINDNRCGHLRMRYTRYIDGGSEANREVNPYWYYKGKLDKAIYEMTYETRVD